MPFPTKILVPVDFGSSSAAALERAVEMARTAQATLHLLHVCPAESASIPSRKIAIPHETRQEAAEKLQALVHQTQSATDRPVSGELTEGVAEIAIVQRAAETHCDLIVMGTHARHGRLRSLAGSVAEGVIRGAHCPVLVVHEQQ